MVPEKCGLATSSTNVEDSVAAGKVIVFELELLNLCGARCLAKSSRPNWLKKEGGKARDAEPAANGSVNYG